MDNLKDKLSNEAENQPSCLGAVMCSSCSSIINPEDKKHCFWEEETIRCRNRYDSKTFHRRKAVRQ